MMCESQKQRQLLLLCFLCTIASFLLGLTQLLAPVSLNYHEPNMVKKVNKQSDLQAVVRRFLIGDMRSYRVHEFR